MATEYDFSSVCRRLDALILIALELSPNGPPNMAGKIRKLVELGFTQPEIAQIIGKKLNYVTATLSRKRNGSSKKSSSTPEST
nr:MAG: hypothetical protein DIU61_19240 [Bacteroidota bacterium]